MRRLQLAQPLPDGLAQTETTLHAVVDGRVQHLAGFLRHAEAPRPERLVDVFRRAARQRELEVVNDPGAVGRQRRDKSPFHQIDQDRSQACLDDVRAKPPDDPAIARARGADSRHDGFEISPGEDAGKRLQQRRHPAASTIRLREVRRVRFALSRRERVGADAGKIELLVWKLHAHEDNAQQDWRVGIRDPRSGRSRLAIRVTRFKNSDR